MFETYELLIRNLLMKEFHLKDLNESMSSNDLLNEIPKEIIDSLVRIKQQLNSIKVRFFNNYYLLALGRTFGVITQVKNR